MIEPAAPLGEPRGTVAGKNGLNDKCTMGKKQYNRTYYYQENGYMIKHKSGWDTYLVMHPITDEVYNIQHTLSNARKWAKQQPHLKL